jgi:hypothetical protein
LNKAGARRQDGLVYDKPGNAAFAIELAAGA